MEHLLTRLQRNATEAIEKAFGSLEDLNAFLPAAIDQVANEQFGQYQCNSPLRLAKHLKKSPMEVAKKIVECFSLLSEEGEKMIASLTIAGPGFINITFLPDFLSHELNELLEDKRLGVPPPKKRKRVIVEFSSPNIAKELHVGHLRSTIIGECLARLFEFLGHNVLRLNHVGDWGTQFGMLIAYLKKHIPEVVSSRSHPELSDLMQWYKQAKKEFDEDPHFKKHAHEEVIKLQRKELASMQAWHKICDISRNAFNAIYSLLDVNIIERGESFYSPYLPDIIKDLEKKGMVQISNGAKCVFLEGFVSKEGEPLPVIVQKADGGFNYETTDIAALKHRVEEEAADRIIIVTDAGQTLHFQMVFKVAEKAGYYNPQKVQVDHVPFGVVLGPDGKKFKTREGETEKLIDLLKKGIEKAKDILKERMPEEPAETIDYYAQVLGIDAIKYADLSCHRLKDYTFSYDRMLRFEGNTAAFLLYSYVRTQSIKRKVGKEIGAVAKCAKISIEHPSEISLAVHIRQFGEALDMVDRDLLPNRLTDYLYILAEKFNAFFRDCRVEGTPEEESRLLLCELTGRILYKGLEILGLQVVDRM